MKSMKQIRVLLPVVCILLLLSAIPQAAFAASPRLIDDADLLTAREEEALSAKLDALSTALDQDIVIITVNDLMGMHVQSRADYLFSEGNYGLGNTDSGILLLVCISTREYAMTTNGDAYDIFNEADKTALEDAFVDHLSDGNYYLAFDAFADKCEYLIQYDKLLPPIWIVISLIIGAIIAGIVIWCMTAKHKSVKKQAAANNYMLRDTFHLDRSRDVFLYSHVTRRARPQNSSSGSRRSGSSGGRSHGRSGRF